MSNNRPPLSLPPRSAPPLPAAQGLQVQQLPAEFKELLKTAPLPWVVGPYDATDGTYMIFVADDIEPVKDSSRMNEYGAVFNGWTATCAKPRHVVSLPLSKAMCDLFVYAVNRLPH